jgi:hypothetical protein
MTEYRPLDSSAIWGGEASENSRSLASSSRSCSAVIDHPFLLAPCRSKIALSADRADQAFGEGILPRASGSREDFLDLHAPHTLAEGVPVDGVSIAEEIAGGGVVGKGVHDLLSSPRRGGMLGDVEVQDPAPMVSAAAIFRTRALMSALTGGRPTVGRPESVAQCSRKRRRCQRRTVLGVTITRDRLHPVQTLASPTQRRRSVVRSLGRVIVRL